jgi:DNA (cytosine-5)-methyltransferase 1
LRFGSVCSGVEAASAAFIPLGWQPIFFSETHNVTNKFLKTKYPTVPNLGDLNQHQTWPLQEIDMLIGGTPCQSFSLRGNRGGTQDPRGQLSRSFFGVVERFRPRWVIWENVPGVLSSNGGRDFGSFIGALAELGYGSSYRVLDGRYFRIAQRRRRVYLVGCLGDWRSAAKVLFEPGYLYGDAPAKRKSPENIARCLTQSTGRSYDLETETFIVDDVGVRRFTPLECERLMGYPDLYTNPRFSDTFRYEALGNSMAVPVIQWLGRRIELVEKDNGFLSEVS